MALFDNSIFGGKPSGSVAPDLQPAKPVKQKEDFEDGSLDPFEAFEEQDISDAEIPEAPNRRNSTKAQKEKSNRPDLAQTFSQVSKVVRASSWVLNRYVLTGAAFITFMLLFDRNDFITQRAVVNQRQALEERIAWHKIELAKLHRERRLLMTDKAALERFAREQYKMKRDNEDLFLIVHEKTTEAE